MRTLSIYAPGRAYDGMILDTEEDPSTEFWWDERPWADGGVQCFYPSGWRNRDPLTGQWVEIWWDAGNLHEGWFPPYVEQERPPHDDAFGDDCECEECSWLCDRQCECVECHPELNEGAILPDHGEGCYCFTCRPRNTRRP